MVRLVDKVCEILSLLAGFVIFVLVVSNVYAVVMRYVFANPLDWPLDVSEFLLVGAVFLGGAYTLQVDGHVNISIFFMRLSSSKQLALKCLHYVIILIFSFILIWKGWELAWDNFHARTSSISLLPLFPSYMIVPIGGFFLLLQAVSKIIKDVFHKRFLD